MIFAISACSSTASEYEKISITKNRQSVNVSTVYKDFKFLQFVV